MNDERFWGKYFLIYDLLCKAFPYQRLLADLVQVLEVQPDDLILDAGSGTGNLSVLLKTVGARPTGYDFSPKAIEIHRRKDKDAEVYLGDLTEKLPFPDNYFDKIVSNNVIYTIAKEDRAAIFQEFYRILKPDGIIVIANVHTEFSPLAILKDHLNENLKINGAINTVKDLIEHSFALSKLYYYSLVLIKQNKIGHYAFVEKDEQKNLLAQAGFKTNGSTLSSYSNQSYIDLGIK